jgi:hypothetical protein
VVLKNARKLLQRFFSFLGVDRIIVEDGMGIWDSGLVFPPMTVGLPWMGHPVIGCAEIESGL